MASGQGLHLRFRVEGLGLMGFWYAGAKQSYSQLLMLMPGLG